MPFASWTRRAATTALFATVLAAHPALALDDKMTPINTPAQPGAITLDTGPLPGATAPEAWHSQYGSVFARNVTVATLTPFLPDPAKATGAAVIVVPGGGFMTLSMQNEGWDVARALQAKGVAAFVLKYRLHPTPEAMPAFEQSMRDMFSGVAHRPPAPQDGPDALAPQIADAKAAFALVRAHAKDWHIDTDRIGMVGFSAGAMLTVSTELYGGDAKPAFLGDIYGPMTALTVPADAPPLFVAVASDDPFFGNSGFGIVDSWHAAKKPVELHYFEQGGHGFGMYDKPTTSTGWFDEFTRWMAMHGYLKPKG